MKHTCPECGFAYVGDLAKCPNCGFPVKEELKENNADSSVTVEDINKTLTEGSDKTFEEDTIGETRDVNDDIQWSEFESMSIGSVADFLNDTLEEPAVADPNQSAEDLTVTKNLPAAETETSEAAFDPMVDSPTPNNILAQYMKEHRHGAEQEATTEEVEATAEAATADQVSEAEAEDVATAAQEATVESAFSATEETPSDSETEKAEEAAAEIAVEDSGAPLVEEPVAQPAAATGDLPKEQVDEAVVEADEAEVKAADETAAVEERNRNTPNLFVLDTDEAKRVAEEIAERDHMYDEILEDDYFEFDDPELVPLPSEDEEVAKKFANLTRPEGSVKNLENHSKLQPLNSAVSPRQTDQKPSDHNQAQAGPAQPTVAEPAKQPVAPVKTQQSAGPKAAKAVKPPKQPKPSKPPKQPKASQREPDQAKRPKKWLYLGAAAIILAGAGGAFAYDAYQKDLAAKAAAAEKQKTLEEAAEEFQAQINDFYTDDSHEYVKSAKVDSDLTSMGKEVEDYQDAAIYKDLVSELGILSNKITVIKEVNGLFTEAVVNGNALAEKPLLKADKEVTLAKQTGTAGFAVLINQAIEEAQGQYKTLQEAKAKVAAVYADGKVMETADRASYQAAVTAVEAVTNQELAKTLLENLAKVATALTEAETKAAAAEANSSTSADNSSSTTSGTNANSNSSGTSSNSSGNSSYTVGDGGALIGFVMNSSGDPIVTSNQGDINDSSNAAWSWAGDVKETVIGKCIDRGYIVEGGYSLQPALIVDGNGFYNLFRSDGSYVVTINCKTGWFKGNGPGGPNTRVN